MLIEKQWSSSNKQENEYIKNDELSELSSHWDSQISVKVTKTSKILNSSIKHTILNNFFNVQK